MSADLFAKWELDGPDWEDELEVWAYCDWLEEQGFGSPREAVAEVMEWASREQKTPVWVVHDPRHWEDGRTRSWAWASRTCRLKIDEVAKLPITLFGYLLEAFYSGKIEERRGWGDMRRYYDSLPQAWGDLRKAAALLAAADGIKGLRKALT